MVWHNYALTITGPPASQIGLYRTRRYCCIISNDNGFAHYLENLQTILIKRGDNIGKSSDIFAKVRSLSHNAPLSDYPFTFERHLLPPTCTLFTYHTPCLYIPYAHSTCAHFLKTAQFIYNMASKDTQHERSSERKSILLSFARPTLHVYLWSEFHGQFVCLISICQFSVKDICDSELSDDAVDHFFTQNRYIIPETNQQDEPVNDSDILETHSTSSEDDHHELNTAQLNLLQYVTEQKTNALKHEGMANHFSSIISSGAREANMRTS